MDVLGVLVAKQTQEKVREILDDMPEKDRRILKEIFLEERDKDDVCTDFGVRPELFAGAFTSGEVVL